MYHYAYSGVMSLESEFLGGFFLKNLSKKGVFWRKSLSL